MKEHFKFAHIPSMLALAIGAVVLAPSVTNAQQIGGTVSDTTGGVLPGVTVEARSPGLIEGVRTVITDGNGQYLIIALEPGTYAVTYSLPGFGTLIRDELELNTGFTANIDIENTRSYSLPRGAAELSCWVRPVCQFKNLKPPSTSTPPKVGR